MSILLVAATAAEIQPTLDALSRYGNEVRSLLTGIGTVPTTFHLTRHLTEQAPFRLVIQAGICGAYDKTLALGEVVHIIRDRFVAQGAEDRDGTWLSQTEIGFPPAEPFDTGGWLTSDPPPGLRLPQREVVGGTVDRSTGAATSIDRVLRHYPELQTESMEGAAFHYVCRRVRVPFVQLRSVSNYVEPRDRGKWQIGPAIHQLNASLRNVIEAALNS